jgi:glycine/serine hydroxymethyltransferase
MEAVGSVLIDKYGEGLPGKRIIGIVSRGGVSAIQHGDKILGFGLSHDR